MKVLCLTWNVAKLSPPDDLDLTSLLSSVHNRTGDYDIVAIGLQEVSWQPLRLLVDSAKQDDPWSSLLVRAMSEKYNFVQLTCSWESHPKMLGTVLQVFAKRELVPDIDCIDSKAVQLGWQGYSRHKSAVALRLHLWSSYITFINCHNDPHIEGNAQRLQQYRQAIEKLNFGSMNVISEGYVFWMGDMNYRVEQLNSAEAFGHITVGDFERLTIHDQLTSARKSGTAFQHFMEGEIKFKPTFKFIVGTSEYDFKRVPAWCDRILYKFDPAGSSSSGSNNNAGNADKDRQPSPVANAALGCELIAYSCCMDVVCSDHKPVKAEFEIKILPENSSHFSRLIEFSFPAGEGDMWFCGQNNVCQFSVNPAYSLANFDWIGLYKPDFRSYHDTVTWLYVLNCWETQSEPVQPSPSPSTPTLSTASGKNEIGASGSPSLPAAMEQKVVAPVSSMSSSPFPHMVQNLLFKSFYIPSAGEYRLGYYSRARNCFLAMTDVFRIATSDMDSCSEAS